MHDGSRSINVVVSCLGLEVVSCVGLTQLARYVKAVKGVGSVLRWALNLARA